MAKLMGTERTFCVFRDCIDLNTTRLLLYKNKEEVYNTH